jgi:peptide/nickel transport system permease protein
MMGRYVLRRAIQALVTIFGVMLLTFVLFRVVAGDVSSAYVNSKLGVEAKRAFNERHKLDRPSVFNFHRRLELIDNTAGTAMFAVQDSGASRLVRLLEIHLAPYDPSHQQDHKLAMVSRLVFNLSPKTLLSSIPTGPSVKKQTPAQPALGSFVEIRLADGTVMNINSGGFATAGQLIKAINENPLNNGKLTAGISQWNIGTLFDSQFFWHLYENVTFSGRSYATDQTILGTILERGKFSLSITVPSFALGWLLAMVISCLVAYYRGKGIDHITVFLAVLGMCIPYLAYMLLGQWAMFKIAPKYAAGLSSPFSIYVPVFIAVVAGLGWEVRFYRVIILNEINKDYVRTARAKGVPLADILFKHVLKNCMLPILTDLISTIPFLIMGALLLEKFFGIPGLGDLFLTSITSRDVPIITGLTYFTTILYVVSLLLTDVLYAVFDPRVRLK